MEYIWVIGRYTGDEAKRVKAQSQTGVGYFLISDDKGDVEVSFRKVVERPLPPHLQKADAFQAKALEKRMLARMGGHADNRGYK